MLFIKKFLYLLSPQEHKKIKYLLVMILISGLLETFGVASIMPFMAVFSNPTLIESNSILKNLFNFTNGLGINSNQEFCLFRCYNFFYLCCQ